MNINPKRLVVFDFDDTLWPLNKRIAEMAGIDYSKMITFMFEDNPLLNKEEKQRLHDLVHSVELWKTISLFPGVERFEELEKDYNCLVKINSNCSTDEVMDYKRKMLPELLNLPSENIILNIGSRHKEMVPGMYAYVDDSPYNIKASTAIYTFYPRAKWNECIEPEIMDNKNIFGLKDLNEIIDKIELLICRDDYNN